MSPMRTTNRNGNDREGEDQEGFDSMSIYVERSTGDYYHLIICADPKSPGKDRIVVIQPVDGYDNRWLEADIFKRDFYAMEESDGPGNSKYDYRSG